MKARPTKDEMEEKGKWLTNEVVLDLTASVVENALAAAAEIRDERSAKAIMRALLLDLSYRSLPPMRRAPSSP